MLPTLSAGRTLRGGIFGRAVISVTTSMLLSAGAAQLAGPPAPAAAPRAAATSTVGPAGTGTAGASSPGRDSGPTQRLIDHCQSRGPRVWLTFDDGGSAQQIGRILTVLRREHVQAIFFPIGSWADANPGLVRRIARAGHLIGDHTFGHVDLAKVSDTRASWQIQHGRTHAVGSVPLLRPPFGAGAYTGRLNALASAAGMRLCTWTVDTRDWTGSSAATIIRRVRHGDAMTPPVEAGGVVILHMNGEHTGRALPGVIHAVRARGLRLHSVPR
jgi:peptidoglycan/xylan/chitin deacetylase (PgdA/CDA1 family)